MCKYFLLTFTVCIHREHFNLNVIQWAVSKFLENIFCLWVGKDMCYHSAGNINLKIIYPAGFVLQWAVSACIFSVLFKVLHVM